MQFTRFPLIVVVTCCVHSQRKKSHAAQHQSRQVSSMLRTQPYIYIYIYMEITY